MLVLELLGLGRMHAVLQTPELSFADKKVVRMFGFYQFVDT
jgi:hypothetical protein